MTQDKLQAIATALADLCPRVYHYLAADKTKPNYIVWAEDGANDLAAGNIHAEGAWQGTVDLFTQIEFDQLIDDIPAKLEEIGASWSLNSVQAEADTGLIHYEWLFEL